MTRSIALGLAVLAGAAIGATAVNGWHAQGGPPRAYAFVDIREVTDPATLKTLLPKIGPSSAPFGENGRLGG